jgi:hypothetical protein
MFAVENALSDAPARVLDNMAEKAMFRLRSYYLIFQESE